MHTSHQDLFFKDCVLERAVPTQLLYHRGDVYGGLHHIYNQGKITREEKG